MSQSLTIRSLALVVTLLVVLSTAPGLAAADSRVGGSVVIAEGETVDSLEVAAGSVIVRGTVDGDLTGVAGDVTIAEGGRVTGDIETAAGSIRIAGIVDGTVSAAGGDITIAESGVIRGNLDAGAGTMTIDGTIQGDATIGAETIRLGSTAAIDGDLTYDGQLRGNRGAVAGIIERDTSLSGPTFMPPEFPTLSNWLFSLYGFLVNLALGALLLLVVPTFSRRVADSAVSDPLRSGGVGLLALVGIPVLLGLIAITIVGIPLTIVGALLFAVVAWIGAVYGRLSVGAWLVSYTDVESYWVGLLVGFAVVAIAVRLPLVGWLAELLVFLLGFGALVLVAYRSWRSGREAAEPAAPEPEGDVSPAD